MRVMAMQQETIRRDARTEKHHQTVDGAETAFIICKFHAGASDVEKLKMHARTPYFCLRLMWHQ